MLMRNWVGAVCVACAAQAFGADPELHLQVDESVPGTCKNVVLIMLVTGDRDIQGFSCGVAHTGEGVEVQIERSAATAGAEFFGARVVSGGMTVGVVLDLDEFVAFPRSSVPTEVIRLTYSTTSQGSLLTTLSFSDTLGSPPVECLFTVGGTRYDFSVLAPPTLSVCVASAPIILTMGVPRSCTLTPALPTQEFVLQPPFGASAAVFSLTDADAADGNAVYVRWGAAPAPWLFDLAAAGRGKAGQQLVIPLDRNDVCHILAEGRVFGGESNEITVLAVAQDLALESMSAATAGEEATSVSASILGAGFTAQTNFWLRQRGGPSTAVAREMLLVSSTRAEVSFDLSGASVGTYDLVAQNPGQAELASAFQVVATQIGPLLEFKIEAPSRCRYNRMTECTIEYANIGDLEMAARLLKIVGPPGSEIKLAREESLQGDQIFALGIHPGGVPGRLPPGGRGRIPVIFRTAHCQSCDFLVQVRAFTPGPQTRVGWDGLAPPAGMTAEDWARAWPALAAAMGETWLEYEEALGRIATRLSRRGADASSVRGLFRFAVREALGRPSAAAVGSVRLPGGAPVAGRNIAALDGGGRVVASGLTDREGSFAIDWLENGATYRLVVDGHDVGVRNITMPLEGDLLGIVLEATPAPANVVAPGCATCDETGLPTAPLEPPAPLFTRAAHALIALVNSWDPNEKDGPVGEGTDRLIPPGQRLTYTIYFENKPPEATAPASRVTIVDELSSYLDWTTFQAGACCIGGRPKQYVDLGAVGSDQTSGYTQDPGSEFYSYGTTLDIVQDSGGTPVYVEVDFLYRLDLQTGRITWEFETVTPSSEGFLLVNDANQQGEGSVSFTIEPIDGIAPGTRIVNYATITFDDNPEQRTDPVFNVIGDFVPFLRGDANADGRRDIADSVFILNYLFRNKDSPLCMKAADANDLGQVDIADTIFILSYLFAHTPPPLEPFAACGTDPTSDALSCQSYGPCGP